MVVFASTAFIIIPFVCTEIDKLFGFQGPLTRIDTPLGIMLAVSGSYLALWCVILFFTIGKGTPAPLHPPERFVVKGPYKYMRNPMMLGAWILLIGEALLLHSPVLLLSSFFIFIPAGTLFITKYEEPDLKERFGDEYLEYMQKVPRWVPKFKRY